jgi:hypothetical protein
MFIVLYEPVRKFVKFNTFDFGGKQGFVSDTITSFIYNIFAGINLNPFELLLFQSFILSVILLTVFVFIINDYHSNKGFFVKNRSLIIVNLILLAISIETIAEHYVFKTDYLMGRFALFLFPLFVLNLGFLSEYFLKFRNRFIIYGLAVSLALLSLTNFYRRADLNSCADWGYDMKTKNAVTALVNDHNSHDPNRKDVKVGINWIFEPTINFYRQTWNIQWLLPVDRDGFTEKDDYRYIFKDDPEYSKNKDYPVIFSSERTNTVLIRKDP